MRKLASIQKIKNLEPIEGADAIEKATVLGWQLVVKKDEFKIGDLCVYCEIDSIMPDKPDFEFLKARGMRVRTIRLRGQVSQGICFPLSILDASVKVEEDVDVTEILGIIKYEPPIPACLSGIMKGKFPSFIPKTDETRVQVLQNVLDKYQGTKCYVTEKLDGSSATYFVKDNQFGVCSRNMELEEDGANSFWKVARETDLENKMKMLNVNIALQGELVGEFIQTNRYKIRGHKVFFFTAFDIDNYRYYNLTELENILKQLELPMVPVLDKNYILENNIDTIVKRATIKSTMDAQSWAEGIVIRPIDEKIDGELSDELGGGRVTFKAINPEFLLKYGE